MKVYIPHLNYTVHKKTFKTAPPELPFAKAYVRKVDKNTCFIYVSEKIDPPTLAHELIHVLQFIYEARSIDFIQEQESTGYLFGWLMGKMMGYSYQRN